MSAVREKYVSMLRESQEASKVVSLHIEGDAADKFEVGFVEDIGPVECTLLCLTPRGEPDGRLVVRLDDIAALEYDDPYGRKIELLYHYRGSVFAPGDAPGKGPSTIDDQLSRAAADNLAATVEDEAGNRFVGFVREATSSYVQLDLLSTYGSPDGTVILSRDRINRVEIGRREEQVRAFLFKYHHGLKKMLEP